MIEHKARLAPKFRWAKQNSVGQALAAGLLASAAFPAILHAQASSQDGGSQDATVAPSAQPAASEPSATSPGDIIVTAQHREQALQDVPIAVSAFRGETLVQSGIQTTESLGQVTPGLNFTRVALFAQPFIRGVGSTTTSLGDESNVSTYIDGVYLVQSETAFYELLNVERVEVLKGPQGTLFGRNATGGAINIVTRAPSFDPSMKVRLTYARFNEVGAQAYVTGGLTEGLAASLSGSVGYRDDYIDQLGTGGKIGERKNFSLQGRVLLEASDNVTFNVIGTLSKTDDPFGLTGRIINRNSIAENPVNGGFNTSMGDYAFHSAQAVSTVLKQRGLTFQADIDLSAFDITSISSYHHLDEHVIVDGDASAAEPEFAPDAVLIDNRSSARDLQQEVRLTSKQGSSFDWLVGAYYFNSHSGYKPQVVYAFSGIPGVAVNLTQGSHQVAEAYAAFADVTVPFSSQFSLSVGGRYSHEKKTLTQTFSIPLFGVPAFTTPERSVSFNAFTPRVVLSFKPNEDLLIYGSYSKGFKSGGFNQAGFGPLSGLIDPPYNPEKLDALELGFKASSSNFLHGGTFNIALFHYKYKDLQVNVVTPPPTGSGTSVIENAAAVKTYGMDAEATLRVTPNFDIRLGTAYLHARYDRYLASVFIPRSTLPVGDPRKCPTGTVQCGNYQTNIDVAGNPVVNTPKWTVNAGFSYNVPIGDYKLVASGNGLYNSGFNWEPLGRISEGSYFMANGQLELQLPGNTFSVAVFVRNLTNARVCSGALVTAVFDYCQYLDPRVAGIRLSGNF